MGDRLRVFISSPGDVRDAREVVAQTVQRVAQDYLRYYRIEPYLWETEVMLASGHFQDAIEAPSQFDIVTLIVWTRLGTPLPEQTAVRSYRGMDGRTPVTGTEWEFEDALQASHAQGVPDLLVYRSCKPAVVDAWDPERRAAELAQLQALDTFWSRHFADRGVFLGAYHKFTDLQDLASAFEAHLRELIARRIELVRGHEGKAVRLWTLAPFNGLQSYSFDQSEIFFGRAEPTGRAIGQLIGNAESGRAFLLILGGSGTGKSSLIRAGISPGLALPRRVAGKSFQRRAEFRPGDRREGEDLFDALARTLITPSQGQRVLIEAGDIAKLARNLRAAPAHGHAHLETALDHVTVDAVRAGSMLACEQAAMLLCIDQLEELFTDPTLSAAEREEFVAFLAGCAHGGRVWVLATMRSDFWHMTAAAPELMGLAEGTGRLDLLPPRPAEISQMIRLPAEAAGLEFERHPSNGTPLNDQIAEEAAGAPGVMPLLSYLLDQLYRRDVEAAKGSALTHGTYERLGGLKGAIATRAEEVLAAQKPAVRETLRAVLFSLVQVNRNEQGADTLTARGCSLAQFALGSAPRQLIDAFVDPGARLLVADEIDGEPIVRLAHEALLTEWARAKAILTENRLYLEIRRQTEERYRRWRADPKASKLLGGDDLADGERLVRSSGLPLADRLIDFVARSGRAARWNRRRAFAIAATIAATTAALAVVAIIAAFDARQQATAAHQANERENSDLHNELLKVEPIGDQLANKGDYDSALLAYGQDLATAQQLAADATTPVYRLDVGLTYARIGFALLKRCGQGDQTAANANFASADAVALELAGASNPDVVTRAAAARLDSQLRQLPRNCSPAVMAQNSRPGTAPHRQPPHVSLQHSEPF